MWRIKHFHTNLAVRGESQSFESINISKGTTYREKKLVAHALPRIRKGIFPQMNKILEHSQGSWHQFFPKKINRNCVTSKHCQNHQQNQ